MGASASTSLENPNAPTFTCRIETIGWNLTSFPWCQVTTKRKSSRPHKTLRVKDPARFSMNWKTCATSLDRFQMRPKINFTIWVRKNYSKTESIRENWDFSSFKMTWQIVHRCWWIKLWVSFRCARFVTRRFWYPWKSSRRFAAIAIAGSIIM